MINVSGYYNCRADLWNQMLAFDAKENDPNRYKNRGGNLLAEEREKKKVLHQLPKVFILLIVLAAVHMCKLDEFSMWIIV